MAIPPLEQQAVAGYLRRFCAERCPAETRDQLALSFEFSQTAVIVYEQRPHFSDPARTLSLPVVKFTYVAARRAWRLLYQDRNLRWRSYPYLPQAKKFVELLDEVRDDPGCLFWG